MTPRRLVVVGASLAGLRAVTAARECGFDGRVTLVGAEEHLPYDRPPLSKEFLAAEEEPPPPTHPDAALLRDGLGVELLLGEPATALDPTARTVTVGGAEIPYDALVIATGARPRVLPAHRPPAPPLDGVHPLRTLDDARAVRRALDAGARTVVVGAGFIGSEVASEARRRGLDVTVVEALPAPMSRSLGAETGAVFADLHTTHGTELRCDTTVTGIEGHGRVERVLLSDGSAVEADLVVVGIGAAPATEWLAGSGVAVRDGVLCDPYLATGTPGVWAAGDVARRQLAGHGRTLRLEHWTNAAEQGALAARNAVGPGPAEPCTTVPYFWSQWYGHRIQFVGLPEGEQVEILGDTATPCFIALYRSGDRLAGALAVNRAGAVPGLRRLVRAGASWAQALAHAGRLATSSSTKGTK
ncbi:FAD-dependent oxidoreductase [Streptomyces sp. RerS4]|uniref:NAD(P)/FAD-dependent oxidoreductase n=1 Tax=Streptomyces sp. RerS4 TaxID=2942449 RepID=UPI00201BBE86|nr:FAD-dependent oxidoreductase [Streptomyces sp. RerS4]UQX03453.1 FAD-dependent oxidoreductase [Streptomyces sp. RerS4]